MTDDYWGTEKISAHSAPTYAISPLFGSNLLLSGGNDHIIKIWDLFSKELIDKVKLINSEIRNISVSPSTQLMFISYKNNMIVFFDWNTKRIIFASSMKGSVWDSIFVNNSQLICGDTKGSLHIIDIFHKKIDTYQIHDDVIRTVTFDSKRNIITTGSYDGFIKQFNLTTNHESLILDLKRTIYKIVYSPSIDSYIVSIDSGSLAQISPELNVLRFWESHQSKVRALIAHPKKKICFAGGDAGIIKIWDLRDVDKPLGTIINGKYEIWNLQFIDTNTIASSNYAGDIYFNRIPKMEPFTRY